MRSWLLFYASRSVSPSSLQSSCKREVAPAAASALGIGRLARTAQAPRQQTVRPLFDRTPPLAARHSAEAMVLRPPHPYNSTMANGTLKAVRNMRFSHRKIAPDSALIIDVFKDVTSRSNPFQPSDLASTALAKLQTLENVQ